MGNLTKIQHSELNATLEILEHLGVEERHLKMIRTDPNRASVVAQTMIAGYVMVDPEKSPKWREEKGVIYFSVISDGTTGDDWIGRLEGNGFRVGNYAKQVLCSSDFKPTNGMTTEVAVLKGMPFKNDDRITKKIRVEADKRNLNKPNAELACLIREKFTDKEIKAMGLWYIIAMHKPIKDSDGDPSLLCVHRGGDGRWLHAYSGRSDGSWDRGSGFAFAVSST